MFIQLISNHGIYVAIKHLFSSQKNAFQKHVSWNTEHEFLIGAGVHRRKISFSALRGANVRQVITQRAHPHKSSIIRWCSLTSMSLEQKKFRKKHQALVCLVFEPINQRKGASGSTSGTLICSMLAKVYMYIYLYPHMCTCSWKKRIKKYSTMHMHRSCVLCFENE